MQSFTFYSPTKVYFGQGVLEKAGAAAAELGASKVFIIYGSDRLKTSGLLDTVANSLNQAGLQVDSMGGVQPNPTLSFAEKCADAARSFGADFIIGLGGGSALDTAKAVAASLANPGVPIWDMWSGKVRLTKSLPTGAILTIPATGSECSNSSVLTNEQTNSKRGLSSDWNRPRFALMDPSTGTTLPPFQAACSVADIMMHTMDRYFNPIHTNQLTDEIAEGLLRVVVRNGGAWLKNLKDTDAASEVFWCGTLSHNGLTGLGGKQDFSPHQLAHPVSAIYGTTHGAALACLWGGWASYVMPHHPGRFAQFGRNVWNLSGDNDVLVAQEAIRKTVTFFQSLGLEITLTGAVGKDSLSDEEISTLTDNCMYGGTRSVIGTFVPLEAKDTDAIYRRACKPLSFD